MSQPDEADTPARSLGGRFAEATDALLARINRSVPIDQRLWRQDIAGSRAHAAMLGKVGLISAEEQAAIDEGLVAVIAEFEAGGFAFRDDDEDIHMAVERRLTELIGAPARKLHTGRSRNDQVMTDVLLWLRDDLARLAETLRGWIGLLCDRAEQGLEQPLPAFTHYQPAQVASVASWLLGHAAAGERNLRRVRDLLARLDESPLGSGANAGGYLPLDRDATAQALGFARPATSAQQATSQRSDLLDALAAMAIIGTDLSRLGEELVLFTSPAYGFLTLPDRLTTGSSLLPHKRNADGAELIRGGGKLAASEFAALASVTSGLAGGYSKDLQHDKALLFGASDRTHDLLLLASAHVEAIGWDAARCEAACTPQLAALWLADRLVTAGLPFREAHHLVGKAARLGGQQGLLDGAREAFAGAHADVLAELAEMTPAGLLAGLVTAGSAAPASCQQQLQTLRARL